MSVYQIDTQVFAYRPRWVSYIFDESGNVRSKYDYSDLATIGSGVNYFSHKKAFIEHTLTWPIAKQVICDKALLLPLNKTIELYDDVAEVTKNIQILKRVVIPLKTVATELLYTITLNFRFIE